MQVQRMRGALFVLVGLALGCATWSHEPGRLLEQGNSKLAQRRFGEAWGDLSAIRAKYPHSAESAEAFTPAALAFQAMYARTRFMPDSPWLTTNSQFMFEWLEAFFVADDFPQGHVDLLIHGMPYAFFVEYQKFAATRPTLARWRLSVTTDNGLIDTIQAERANGKPASAS